MFLTFKSVDEILNCDHLNKLLSPGTFPWYYIIILYNEALNVEFVDEILTFDHSNESYRAVPSFGIVSLLIFGKMKFDRFCGQSLGDNVPVLRSRCIRLYQSR